MSQKVYYDFALNKRLRLFLRTEHLLKTALLDNQAKNNSKLKLWGLCEVLNILDKSPFLSELSKELESNKQQLTKLIDTPCVDVNRLNTILEEIDRAFKYLGLIKEPLNNLLRNHAFLNKTRQFGVGCFYGLQEDHLSLMAWNQLSRDHQQELFDYWLDIIQPIMHALSLVLHLIRQSSVPTVEIAQSGKFQKGVKHQSLQLVRVEIDPILGVYPSLNVSRHLINIRFMAPLLKEGLKDEISRDDIHFELTCCDV